MDTVNFEDQSNYMVEVQSTDYFGAVFSETLTIEVNDLNDAPVITQTVSPEVIMDEDGIPIAFVAPTIDATDEDNDLLTWSLGADATSGTATVSGTGTTPTVTYTPIPDFNGSVSFGVIVSDAEDSASITVNVTVSPVNDLPVANDDSGGTDEDTAVTIDVLGNDTDVDGESLSVSSVTQPANGTVVNNGTDVAYTPDADFNGVDSFTYTSNDGTVDSSTATVTVTVAAVNDAPSISPQERSIEENAANGTNVGAPIVAVDEQMRTWIHFTR